ncbi:hypothetical protein FNV43_RR01151 [Rhamnella rubrinervis]|uniref:Uncharacterized protein n=1 Tax=Rhamnella rubrinervis TaxID=2594499 RepID=A0A8K0MSK6_9ROSA|nr:hypothetical protein FNV43_RR01151 [Rhamnella rubrinervis]
MRIESTLHLRLESRRLGITPTKERDRTLLGLKPKSYILSKTLPLGESWPASEETSRRSRITLKRPFHPKKFPKLKMKISKAELEATKKKKNKQAAAKGGASSASDKGQERPTLNVVVEPSSLPIAIPSGDSPPPKRPRRSSPPAPVQDKGKENKLHQSLGLEDSYYHPRTHHRPDR